MPRWRVHVELKTRSLVDSAQLGMVRAELTAGSAVVQASVSAASLGSRNSVIANVRLESADEETALDHATGLARKACMELGIGTGEILAAGILAYE